MALQQFWTNVRLGASMIAPTATADSPRIASSDIQRLLQGATLWLTPKAVAGFNEHDFEFLAENVRQDLQNAVDGFLKIAKEVNPQGAATDQQIQSALPHFQRIIEILGANRYADPEAWALGRKIEEAVEGRLPESVLELRFETGEDSNGGAGLWIWVVLDDKVTENESALLATLKSIREQLTETARELGVKHWPYVRFRTVADLEPADTQGRRG